MLSYMEAVKNFAVLDLESFSKTPSKTLVYYVAHSRILCIMRQQRLIYASETV